MSMSIYRISIRPESLHTFSIICFGNPLIKEICRLSTGHLSIATSSATHKFLISPHLFEVMRLEESSEESSDSSSEIDLSETFKDLYSVLQHNPSEKNNRKQEFLCILGQLCTQLTVEENYSEVLDCYHQALTLYPTSEEVLYNLGALLLRLGHPRESSLYLRNALESCPDYLPAHYALLSVRNYLVERWHFRMLNDQTRNEVFRIAISNRVSQGHDTVLDIGTGTGILSIFAAEAGAKEVWSCDVSDTMIDIATEVVTANGVSRKVHLLNKLSLDIKIPDDLPQRVSLVVTETFDAALFGEGALLALQHAWQELLHPSPVGVVIPHSASLWVAPIECSYISRRYVVQQHATENLLKIPNVNISSEMTDPYDTENLLRLPGSFRLLAEPVKALAVNFNSLEDIESHLQSEGTTISFTSTQTGRLDAFAAWFDLNMDEKEVLTTRPFVEEHFKRAACWEQAIFPQSYVTPINEGASLKVFMSNKDSRLEMKVLSEEVMDAANLVVPQPVVCFLNNSPWMKEYCDTADTLFESWKDLKSGTEILDLSPFPIMGLRFLVRCGSKGRWHMTCVDYKSDHARLVNMVAAENGIPEGRIHFIEEDDLPGKTFRLIVWNFFDPKGELDDKVIAQYPEIKSLLAPEGLIVPHNLTVRCELVESEFLYKCSRVENDSRQIADFINIYEVKHHLDLNLDCVGATPLCKENDVLRLQVDQLGPGGLFSEQKRSVCAKIERGGTLHAVAYWFLIEMLSNTGRYLSTRGPHSHISQAAVLTLPLVPVQVGQVVKLAIPYHYGLLQIEVMEND